MLKVVGEAAEMADSLYSPIVFMNGTSRPLQCLLIELVEHSRTEPHALGPVWINITLFPHIALLNESVAHRSVLEREIRALPLFPYSLITSHCVTLRRDPTVYARAHGMVAFDCRSALKFAIAARPCTICSSRTL